MRHLHLVFRYFTVFAYRIAIIGTYHAHVESFHPHILQTKHSGGDVGIR
jgi:hypothetical protein